MKTFLWVITIIIALSGAIVAWGVSPYFMSRRDRYRNSQYQIARTKFVWSCSVAILIIIVGAIIIDALLNDGRGINSL